MATPLHIHCSKKKTFYREAEMDVQKLARDINDLRVIPRLMVGAYGWFFVKVAMWFMALPEPNGPQSAFAGMFVGAAGAFFGFYTNTGGSK